MPYSTIFSVGCLISSIFLPNFAESNSIEPVTFFTRPEIERMTEDLPAPLAPIRVTIDPLGISIFTSWTAWIAL